MILAPIFRGYTLVLALMLCGFTLLLALSTCTLVTLHLQSGSASLARAQARLNAIAAGRIALGELQTAVGPDRRVTANAALLDDGTADNRVHRPQWCGVWRTDRRVTETSGVPPFIHRTPEGALVDDRFARNSARTYTPRAEVLRWLVSGPKPDAFTPASSGEVTLAPATAMHPEVKVALDGDASTGRFAWWAADENQKACIAIRNPAPPTNRPPQASGTGLALLPGWQTDGARPALPPPSRDSLAATGLIAAPALAELTHDITTDSAGVFADCRRGGLRRDLTPFLTSTGEFDGLKDDLPLLDDGIPGNPFATHGPRLGLLRHWANLHTPAALTPSAGSRHLPSGSRSADLFHDGTHANLPDVGAPTAPVIAPVLTEAAVYRRLSVDTTRRNASNAPWLRLHLHPRVVLWNPYADTLAPARYLVHLRVTGSPVFSLTKAGKKLTGAISGWRVYDDKLVNYATTQGTLLFLVDCPALPPGESRLFLPEATAPLYGKSATSKTYDPLANRLVPAAALSNASFYLEDLDAFEDAGVKALAGADLTGESWRLENAAAEDFAMGLKLLPPAVASDWKTLRQAPTLRYTSGSVKCGVGTTPMAGWPAGRTEPLLDRLDAPPPAGSREGLRLRHFQESPANLAAYSPGTHLEVAPLADHNPLAPLSALHPLANTTPAAGAGNRRAEQFGAYVRDESDPASDWATFSPVPGVTAHPFGPPTRFTLGRAVVIAGFPTEAGHATSPADFAETPLSPYAWHPARVLGESRLSPVAPAAATAHGFSAESFAALGAGAVHLTNLVRAAEAPAALRVCDLRFEANHALWDRYTFLSGSAAERENFARNPAGVPLPHGHLRSAPGADLTRLTEPGATTTGPAAVLLEGAFNINSTSIIAWKQLLAEARGLGPSGSATGGAPGQTPYPRHGYNPGPAASAADSETAATFGHGYRSLSDAELDALARTIVDEVRRRGPFLSLSDWVNRRLSDEPVSVTPALPSRNAGGALQAALDRAGINPLLAAPHGTLARNATLPDTRFIAAHQAPSRFDGAAAILGPSDLLRAIGPRLTARGDTFRVTVLGLAPAIGATAPTTARAELTIQRTPSPVFPDPVDPLNPDTKNRPDFGRRLVITGWRWIE